MPREAHQFPVVVVVTEAVDVVEVGITCAVEVVVAVDVAAAVDVVVAVDVAVAVEEEQDANTIDVTMMQVTRMKMAPFFIFASFYY
jgi:hypothetical protein